MRSAGIGLALVLLVCCRAVCGQALNVTVDDLLQRGADYDGKEVIVSGAYRVGYEWQELKCEAHGRSIWVDFDPEVKGLKKIRRANRFDQIYAVRFRGVFQAGEKNYGHLNGYSSQLTVLEVDKATRLWRLGRHSGLPANELFTKACSPPK